MNNDKRTTRELAIKWWLHDDIGDRVGLREKYGYDPMSQISLEEIEAIYLSEHLLTEQPKSNVEYLRGKMDMFFEKTSGEELALKLEQPLQGIKEGDILEVYKNEEWSLAGNIPDENGNWLIWDKLNDEIIGSAKIEGIAEMMSLAPQLAKENKELREANERLKEALHKMYITFNTHDNVEDWLILEEAKQALNQ